MTAIETQQLTKRYGDVVALKDLDLVVEAGEIYGFLGPNGAGKTTTINLLLSLVPPTSGRAWLFGKPVGEDIRSLHQRIGVLPAHADLYERLTARQHLEFVIRVKGADDEPEALLERVGIPDTADRHAGDFSSGMAQRLKLAMALAGQPELLVLDEPTTGLDPNGAREMRSIIREENERGATVFFSSHILDQVEAVCDRVGILDRGELVAEDTIDELRKQATGAAQLTVTATGQLEGLDQRLRRLEAVTEVSIDGQQVTAILTERDGKGSVMNEIAQTDLEIRDFEFSEESLEDLFVDFTDGGRDGHTAQQPAHSPRPQGVKRRGRRSREAEVDR